MPTHVATRSPGRRGLLTTLLLGGMAGVLLNCSQDTTGTDVSLPISYAVLRLDEHAINMSVTPPANTLQLTATLFNLAGAPVSVTGQIHFQTPDTSVTVSPAGVVTARYATPAGGGRVASVIASLQQGNHTFADTAYVRVTASAPGAPIATFSIQPGAGDSAQRSLSDNPYVATVSATDSLGNTMRFASLSKVSEVRASGNGNIYCLMSANPVIMSANLGANGMSPLCMQPLEYSDTGHVTLRATAWVYGKHVQDSLPFTVGWTQFFFFQLANGGVATSSGTGLTTVIGVGGVLDWLNYSSGNPDVIFDDSTDVAAGFDPFSGAPTGTGGNIHGFTSFFASRSFPVAGTYYWYTSVDPGTRRVIYVRSNPR